MTPALLQLGVAMLAVVASAVLILLLRPILRRYTLSMPNARSSHRIPTPTGGGFAVVAATLLALIPAAGAAMLSPPLAAVLAATVMIAIVGAIDDVRPIPVAPRLLLQAAAAVAVVLALPAEMRMVEALPWLAERALLVVALLWFVNLVNFMDGLDWMTVAEIVPVTAGLVAIGLLGGLPGPAIAAAAALLGAMLGFAPFNRPVASLFLGDVGSLPVGLVTGWLLLVLAGQGHWAAALLLPLYYLADATLTLLRRAARRERVWEAHRTHFYQRATDHGLRVGQIVARVFAVNVALAVLALVTVLYPSAWSGIAALACGAALVAWLLRDFARRR